MTLQLPDTYHSAGPRRGTPTLKIYEGRDILFSGWRQAAPALRGVAMAPGWCVMMNAGPEAFRRRQPRRRRPGPYAPAGPGPAGMDGRDVRVQDHPPV